MTDAQYPAVYSAERKLRARIAAPLRRWRDPLILVALLAIHTAATATWLAFDMFEIEVVPDQHLHAAEVVRVHTVLRVFGLSGLAELIQVEGVYGFLGHLPGGLAALIWGNSPYVLRLANMLFFGLLLWGTYLLGRECHSRQAGLLAACLVTLTPAAYGGCRTISLDFPLLCVMPMALYFLLRTDGFVRPRASAAFGIACGLAVMVKPQALLFLFWPAAAELVISLRRAGQAPDSPAGWRRPLTGASLALYALAATSAIYFAPRLNQLVGMLQRHSTGVGMEFHEGDISTFGGVLFSLGYLPAFLTGPLVVALALALVGMIRHRRFRMIFLVWFLLPLALHVVLKVRSVRYLYPLAPVVVLLVSMALLSLKRGWRRNTATGVLAASMVLMWVTCSALSTSSYRRIDLGQPNLFHCSGSEPPGTPWQWLTTCGSTINTGPPRHYESSTGRGLAKMLESVLRPLAEGRASSGTPSRKGGRRQRTPLVLYDDFGGGQQTLFNTLQQIDGEVLMSPHFARYFPYLNKMTNHFDVLLLRAVTPARAGWKQVARYQCQPGDQNLCLLSDHYILWRYTKTAQKQRLPGRRAGRLR